VEGEGRPFLDREAARGMSDVRRGDGHYSGFLCVPIGFARVLEEQVAVRPTSRRDMESGRAARSAVISVDESRSDCLAEDDVIGARIGTRASLDHDAKRSSCGGLFARRIWVLPESSGANGASSTYASYSAVPPSRRPRRPNPGPSTASGPPDSLKRADGREIEQIRSIHFAMPPPDRHEEPVCRGGSRGAPVSQVYRDRQRASPPRSRRAQSKRSAGRRGRPHAVTDVPSRCSRDHDAQA